MFDDIAAVIICSEYDHNIPRVGSNLAMQLRFKLNVDHSREYGYRHLDILIYSAAGHNYVGVYAKLGWNVTKNEVLENEADEVLDNEPEFDGYEEEPDLKYVKGETPWVLLVYHDSCWRDGIDSILRKYSDRISHIDTLFMGKNGWYSTVQIDEEMDEKLYDIRASTPGYGGEGKRVKLEDLDFKFPEVEVHGA